MWVEVKVEGKVEVKVEVEDLAEDILPCSPPSLRAGKNPGRQVVVEGRRQEDWPWGD